MIGVVFTATSVNAHQMQWEYVLSNFKPDLLYCVGDNQMSGNVLSHATSVESAEDIPEDMNIILMSPRNALNIPGKNSIEDFEHPEHAVYWFGSDSRHLEADIFSVRPPDSIVYIPTDTKDQMFSFVAWAVTAWDRRSKGL